DLVGGKGEKKAEVTVAITIGNETRTSNQLHLTGDLGKKVKVGKGKKIVWKVLKDFPDGPEGDLNWDIKSTSQAASENTQANTGVSSLQAQTDLDNLTKMLDENNYSHEKRISYYKAFINDYKGTMAAKEAADLIAQEEKKAGQERSQEEAQQRRIYEGKRQGVIDDPHSGLQWVPAPGQDF